MASLSSSLRGLAVLLLASSPALLHAATLTVPSAAHPTIQFSVDAAHDGDTVLVADGTYTGNGNRDIDFHGKSLTVKSAHARPRQSLTAAAMGLPTAPAAIAVFIFTAARRR